MRKPSSGQPVTRQETDAILPAVSQAHACGQEISARRVRGPGAADARAKQWLEEHQAAIEAWNKHVEQNGIPLSEFRQL